jgi:signal transduction histidine kinase
MPRQQGEPLFAPGEREQARFLETRRAQGKWMMGTFEGNDRPAEANQLLMSEVLRVLNGSGDLQPLIGQVLRVIRARTGFDAVGLRMREGPDFPYYVQHGFPEEFVRQENSLCAKREDGSIVRDAQGQTVLECTCGLILSGRPDPSMSCFTERGSFWTNRSSDLLALGPEADPRCHPRNHCIHSGYQSVALIPVRSGPEILGLLQLNARQEGQLPLELVQFFEGLADNLGLALRRKQAEEALRELNATLEAKVAQRTAELERRARQLQKLTLELTQAEERERRRIAVILHEDLQQQIAGARFYLNAMRNQAPSKQQQACLEKVDTLLAETIEQSRRLSYDLSPAVVHMNDLADVLPWLAQRMDAQHGLSVRMSFLGDMKLHSEALATFLFRAAQEMLFNVIKHAHVREAAIRVRRIGRYVCLSVSDVGRGFDLEELEGTSGFGLFSIRERAELLGGRMKVKSTKGRGSRLRIMVPDGRPVVAPPPAVTDVPQPRAAGLPSNGALHVLLVDDHEVVRAGLAALVRETRGLELVGEAPDGRRAIDMAVGLRPDVVLMDVSMPLMGGDRATRQIKACLPRTRVIALSMYDEAEKKEKMLEAGAEGYILKTVSGDELLAAIRGKEPHS